MAPRNPEQEKEILQVFHGLQSTVRVTVVLFQWIEAVLDEKLPEGDFAEVLQNGVILCRLMNKIKPDSVKKFKEKGPAFLLMENVQSFLTAAKKYGVPDEEVFQTPDLFEARNIPQVSLCIFSLGIVLLLPPIVQFWR